MERYWVPSDAESALFGTKIADDFFGVNVGGDIGFLIGVLKHLDRERRRRRGVRRPRTPRASTTVARGGGRAAWDDARGAPRAPPAERCDELRRTARPSARPPCFVWSMGITQHASGEDNVRAIVNLALARGLRRAATTAG